MLKKLMAWFEKAFDRGIETLKGYARAHPVTTAVIVIVALVSFGVGVGVGQEQGGKDVSSSAPTSSRDPNLQDTVETLQEEIDSLQGRLAETEGELADAEDQLQQASAQVPLPDLVGKDMNAVQGILDDHGWQVGSTSHQETDSVPEGTVLAQSPKPGKIMTFGGPVKLTLAKAPPPGWKDIKVWTGQGSFNTPEVRIPNGKVRLVYDFSGSTNAIILMKRRPDKWVELYLNEIGDRQGNTRVYYSGKYYFNIEGGSWTVTIQEWR